MTSIFDNSRTIDTRAWYNGDNEIKKKRQKLFDFCQRSVSDTDRYENDFFLKILSLQ